MMRHSLLLPSRLRLFGLLLLLDAALSLNPSYLPKDGVASSALMERPSISSIVPETNAKKQQSNSQQNNIDDEDDSADAMKLSRRQVLVALGSMGVVLSTGSQAQAMDGQQKSALLASSESLSSTAVTPNAAAPALVDWSRIFEKASRKALGGGRAGASAAVVQVCSLMWLRTSMNYQYRYGGNLITSLQTLWGEGGLGRLYQGLPFAIIQGPLTRFGDTAANVGILALLDSLPQTQDLPLPLKTACGSAAAGLWRVCLMPIDSSKTAMQVEGSKGLTKLWDSVSQEGPGPLYRGAVAQAAATAVGHFPWFLTYNFFNEKIPEVSASDDLFLSLVRSAILGILASCVSDCSSNSLRVIKTTKQTALLGSDVNATDDEKSTKMTMPTTKEPTYREVVAMILENDGIVGLLGRGLQTRLLTNAIQGAVFSVLWRYFQQVGS